MQNEELAAQRQEIEALRNEKVRSTRINLIVKCDPGELGATPSRSTTGHGKEYRGWCAEDTGVLLCCTASMTVYFYQDEVKRHFGQQKAENSRLQQQITTLKVILMIDSADIFTSSGREDFITAADFGIATEDSRDRGANRHGLKWSLPFLA